MILNIFILISAIFFQSISSAFNCSDECSTYKNQPVIFRETKIGDFNLSIGTVECQFSLQNNQCKSDTIYLFDKFCFNQCSGCFNFNEKVSNQSYSIDNNSTTIDIYTENSPFQYTIYVGCKNHYYLFNEFSTNQFYTSEGSIDFRKSSKFIRDLMKFKSNKSNATQLKLELSNEKHVIYFNIKAINWRICENKCLQFCKPNRIRTNYTCMLEVDDKSIVGGYKKCLKNNNQSGINEYDGFCQLSNRTLCKNQCINMANCYQTRSYACIKNLKNDAWTEDEYFVYDKELYKDQLIGIDQVKWNKLNINKVMFNECAYSRYLCYEPTGNSITTTATTKCVDNKLGFSCTKPGKINLTECNKMMKSSPYWQCLPINTQLFELNEKQENIEFNTATVQKFMDYIDTGNLSKMEQKSEVIGMMKDLEKIANTSKPVDLSTNTREIFGAFLLRKMEEIIIASLFGSENRKPVQMIKNSSIIFRKRQITSRSNDFHIPGIISTNARNMDNPFIKLQIPDFKNNTHGVYASLIYYRNVDLMGEQTQISRLRRRSNLLLLQPQSNRTSRYLMNSDIFSIKLSSNNTLVSNMTIAYKINPWQPNENQQLSWMYQIEETCGFLDVDRGWVWSKRGCRKVLRDPQGVSKQWYCECSHLTNFAMLFSLHQMNQWHFHVTQYLSVIGAIVQCCSLLLFVVFALWINSRDKLRLDLFNVALCLLSSTLVFSIGGLIAGTTSSELSEGQDSGGGTSQLGCSLVALVTQYLLLAAFIWKLMLGINVVRMVSSIRYQEDWLVKYRILLIGVCYSVPMLIIALAAALDFKSYGMIASNVCWIYPGSRAYLSFVVPVGIVVAVNILVLIFIAQVLIKNYLDTHKTKVNGSNELLVFVQLSVSMGLTWLPCYFATMYLWAQYMFVIGFPCQGLLMFLLVVVINKENREKVSSFLASFTEFKSRTKSIKKSSTGHRTNSLVLSSSGSATHNNKYNVNNHHIDGRDDTAMLTTSDCDVNFNCSNSSNQNTSLALPLVSHRNTSVDSNDKEEFNLHCTLLHSPSEDSNGSDCYKTSNSNEC